MTDIASTYAIVICDRCKSKTDKDLPAALALVELLHNHEISDGFKLETATCLAACNHPLAVAFIAPSKASYLFAGIDPRKDIDALLAFGRQYRRLADGWCKEGDRPAGLRGKTVARIPAIVGLVHG